MRPLVIALFIAATAGLLFLLVRDRNGTPTEGNEHRVETARADPAASAAPQGTLPAGPATPPVPVTELPPGGRTVAGIIADDRFTRLDDGRSISNEGYAVARSLHLPDTTVEDDLSHLESIFGLYTWAYQEMPEGGENYEMMTALTGNNPHKVIFFPPDHGSFDKEGNLLDRWGTPYFFHKLSGQQVDVVSAGPDRRLWTKDDVGLGLTEDYTGAYETASFD